MSVYYSDDLVALHHGSAEPVLAGMPTGSVDCVVTSPPHYGLRDYGVPGQIGTEATPAGYVSGLRAVLAEVMRVLADDGTLWLVLGDVYSSGNRAVSNLAGWSTTNGRGGAHRVKAAQQGRSGCGDLPAKNLMGMPWRVAFALLGHRTGRNPRDVRQIPTRPFNHAHFATFPVEIPQRAIAAGCRAGGMVLDPFSGSGTTGLAAAELGHPYIGIDINADYLQLSLRTRPEQPTLTAHAVTITTAAP